MADDPKQDDPKEKPVYGRRKVPLHRAWTPEKVRERIRISALVTRLMKCAMGTVEMNKVQVTAALGLLKKGLPDLTAVQMTAYLTHKNAQELTDAELLNIASRGSEGAVAPPPIEGVDPSVH